MNNLLAALQWRYATKKMNGQSVSKDKVQQIIEAAYLAPTSNGLQPFEVYCISNQELKEKILPIAWNQTQIVDSSHLLVFAVWDDYTKERIDNIFQILLKERTQPHAEDKTESSNFNVEEGINTYRNLIIKQYVGRDKKANFEHAARQAYIGFAMAMAEAAELKVDCTPMEGFDPDALDKLLDFEKKGLKSVLLLPLGYRDEKNDWLVHLKKVRHPMKDFLTEID